MLFQGRLEEELMSTRLREVEGMAELKELRLKVICIIIIIHILCPTAESHHQHHHMEVITELKDPQFQFNRKFDV